MSDKVKTANNRLKILYLYKILWEKTDENHPISMPKIVEELEQCGIFAERKALYQDIEALRSFGLDIITLKGSQTGYFVASRDFELPELKLLADAVTSSKFLTEKKAAALLTKLESLCSSYEAVQLKRQVFVCNRDKSFNEKIYLTVDVIHRAINEGKQITFKYFDYDVNKKKSYRQGQRSCSPYALVWNEERYYLVAYYEKYGQITNFRVDRMENAEIAEQAAMPLPKDFNPANYLSSAFSMFSGKRQQVKLKFHSSLINPVIDRFGKGAKTVTLDDDSFILVTEVQTQRPQPFFSWLFLFGEQAEILEPASLRREYEDTLLRIANKYKGK
ncbi:MAG: WYL domain-containing protein [Firmicutes bacterium]|nr:WYL domain-containing protein [[Eubacterium] siraeum]MCM1488280.1 WYL domain-containing protein [Bacillota bacterium]